MVRKLSLAVALALGISPLSVQALGLGEIQLKSALNQYLSADIELLSVDVEEVDDIRVELASPEAFNRAGVDRPFILTKLEFKSVERSGGKKVIELSSQAPIREPFLNFLIEVNWPKGKLVREYTVLLDPPATLNRRPAPVKTPETKPPVSTAVSNRVSNEPPDASVVTSSDVSWAGGDQSQAPRTSAAAFGSDYGPTKRNDTLWGIAKQVRHDDASIHQMMMALFESNPEAFIGSNINNLKVGQVLRIPDREQVLSLSQREAYLAYSRQVQEWEADRQPVAAQESSEVAKTGTQDNAPTAMADDQADAGDQLKIATARPDGEGEAGSSEGDEPAKALDELRQDLLIAEEAKAGALQEGEELKSRVADLESQLQDLQRLLELKNDQLAQLQAAVGGELPADAAPAETAEIDPATATETAEIDPAAATETADGAVEESAEQPAVVTDEQPAVDPVVAAETPDQVAAEPVTEQADATAPVVEEPAAPVVAEAQPEPKPEVKPEPPKPVVKTKPTLEERSLYERVMGDTTLLGGIIGGIVVLLAMLWVLISRRRSNSADFQESILVNTIDDEEQTEPPEITAQQSEETSFLSDFSPSDIDALQNETGEVDPLAEADVYIAYGRYQQAEELVKQAINKDPERLELKQKLAEILFATKDKDAYLALAEEMRGDDIDNQNPELWGRIVSMGAQLMPGAALFSGAAVAAADESVASETEELDEILNLDADLGAEFNLDELEIDEADSKDVVAEEKPASGDDDLDFDLDLNLDTLDKGVHEDTGSLESLADIADLSEKTEMLDIDVGLDLDAETTALGLDDNESLDLDLEPGNDVVAELGLGGDQQEDLKHFEEPTSEVIQLKIDDPLEEAEVADLANDSLDLGDLGDLDLDLSGFNPGSEVDNESATIDEVSEQLENALEESAYTLDDLDVGDGAEISLDTGEEPSEDDEVNTKIDLARAYVDMGDPEGARDILGEVLEEGNDTQKGEAQEMLDSLS
ncbi:MAG: LysM peptidoglycan-binding domain-containing protein [Chromatiales bacterium]|nr:LysM peptidoglycan-binding domain-containing protein [Chromatiales bacterium]